MKTKMKNESLRFWSFVAWAIMALCAITGGIVALGYLKHAVGGCCFAVAAVAFAGAWLMLPKGELEIEGEVHTVDDVEKLAESLGFTFEQIKTDRLIALNVTRQKWGDMRLRLSLNEPLSIRVNDWTNEATMRCAACWYRQGIVLKSFPYGVDYGLMCESFVIDGSGDTFEGCEFQSVCEDAKKTLEKVGLFTNDKRANLEAALTLCKGQTNEVIALLDEKIAEAKVEDMKILHNHNAKKTVENPRGGYTPKQRSGKFHPPKKSGSGEIILKGGKR